MGLPDSKVRGYQGLGAMGLIRTWISERAKLPRFVVRSSRAYYAMMNITPTNTLPFPPADIAFTVLPGLRAGREKATVCDPNDPFHPFAAT